MPRPAAAYSSQGVRLRDPAPECNRDGEVCIRLSHRLEDTCAAIETLARQNDLPAGFFARLIWRESLFDPYAISHAGARGIAQFMPATAARRDLIDPFNPAAALAASAQYLADLRSQFGNLGLAAAAYNAGEDRVARFVAEQSGLPGETRAYVIGITGHRGEVWRDAPPAEVDWALDGETPFAEACTARAAERRLPQFKGTPGPTGWVVILAAHQNRDVARARFDAAARRTPALKPHEPVITKTRLPSMRASQYVAQIRSDSRAEAVLLCDQIKRFGSSCAVHRN